MFARVGIVIQTELVVERGCKREVVVVVVVVDSRDGTGTRFTWSKTVGASCVRTLRTSLRSVGVVVHMFVLAAEPVTFGDFVTAGHVGGLWVGGKGV